ncbi:exopolysaccharide biosynthesis GT4 family glycosyltransferase EpsE [Salinihabitans flavidus]|uniref:exopolysaccharide biosynthesis GT4 family glycosyltransferase EpsE n=1 Tax=Salinihabitans flavidus TaxID=569882 RepID=UPI000B86703D
MTLGYLIPQFPGQTHIFFWREIAALEARGVDVRIFSTRKPPPRLISHGWSEEAIARTEYLGAIKPLKALQTFLTLRPADWWADLRREGRGLARDLAMSAAAAQQLRQSCAAQGITHLHVHSCGRAALIAALARRMGGVPYSLTLHGPLSDYGPGQRLKWRHADFATVITRKLRDELPSALGPDLPSRVPIQPMGVDTDALRREAPYIPARPGEPLHIVSCGRLNAVKGHQDLMEAVRLLQDRGIDARLEIAGEDDSGGHGFRTELEARIKDLNLGDKITLLGAISGDEVKARLLSAHVFALASWHEPLGVAYMEAMSCGLPVIGTNAGGVPELITDGENGLLVPPRSPDALADAIAALADDPDRARQIATAGRAHVERNFRSDLGAETLIREIRA